LADALEGMRLLFKMRTASSRHVGKTGRATMYFRPVAETVASLRAIAKCVTALK
jgi:hypothetical protein